MYMATLTVHPMELAFTPLLMVGVLGATRNYDYTRLTRFNYKNEINESMLNDNDIALHC